MTIGDDIAARIRRLFHAEKWRIGTISTQLCIHHSVVRRVLDQEHQVTSVPNPPTLIDVYLPFVLETLHHYPTLTASRLYAMVRERGYRGSESHFRRLVARHRPKPIRSGEAYLRLRTLPGEQAQIDWGHFGYLQIGRAKRPLMAFVMVLSYSRRIFLRFYLDARMENFLRGHVAAFTAIDGVPRTLLYDNLKSAVLERDGQAIRFNPVLLDFAGYHRFEPKPVAVARGNEKGRVERAIRYIRGAFFAAREFKDLDDLNEQAIVWCMGPASERPCPEDSTRTVNEVFIQEQPRLLPLPKDRYPTEERLTVSSGKTPYIRFDLNDYSIPHTHVRKTLTLIASPSEVQILDGSHCVAAHPRSYDKGDQIETREHIQALVVAKQKARLHRTQDRLATTLTNAQDFLIAAGEKGYVLPTVARDLEALLDSYGADELAIAMTEALGAGSPHPKTVYLALERRREKQNRPPPIAIQLSEKARKHDAPVRTHDLETYDQLSGDSDDESTDT
jgi:transposase